MRILLLACCALMASASAQAQVWSLNQMKQVGYQDCVNRGGSPQFCSCYVNRWVGLWSPYDIRVWSATGSATPNMRAMESVAARQCGAR
jgi:hypothetical protein